MTWACGYGLCFALVAVAALALPAAAQDGAGAAEPASCDEIRLEGASTRAEEDAGFREQWQPALRRAAECLAEAGERACIEVQGQYDEQSFDDEMGRVAGGGHAAQIQRARGRSGAVVSELVDSLGVDYTRVRERPPGTEPTFRGATVRLMEGCLPAPPAAEMPEWASSPEALEATMRERGLVRAERPEPEPEPAPQPAPQPAAPEYGPFSVDARLGLGFMLASPSDAFTADLRAGFGWGEDRFYARAFAGLGTADQLEQRVAWEWGLAGGVRPLRWLRVGGRFTNRFGTFEAFDTWLEQSWLLAVESEQRILDGHRVSVWIGEHITPLGFRRQRATVQNGSVFDSPDRTDYAFAAGISIIVRGHLGLGGGLPGSPPGD